MGSKTQIQWTDATWNPVVGCTKVSAGCAHCYAARMASRGLKPFEGTAKGGNWTGTILLKPEALDIPLHWRKPRRIFVCSMADLFHEDVPDEFVWSVFRTIAMCPQHSFQLLTKRPERMEKFLRGRFWRNIGRISNDGDFYAPIIFGEQREGDAPFLPNAWLGVSIEDQKTADERIPWLLKTPASVRFVSAEPLLGPLHIGRYMAHSIMCEELPGPGMNGGQPCHCSRIDWLITGGETGPGARPAHPGWFRSLRYQCVEAGVPFFHKQNGEWLDFDSISASMALKRETPYQLQQIDGLPMYRVGKPVAGRELDGRTWDEFPEARA